MSGGFGLPILNLQDAVGKIGTAYTDAYDKAVQQGALAQLGSQLQAGNYSDAAKTAFDAGDAATGLSLIKLGQSAEQQKQAAAAFGALGSLYGGGAGGGAMGLGGATGAASAGISRSGGAAPSFLDLGGPSGGYLAGLIQRESGGNPNARAGTSSATGLGQFTDRTWAGVMRLHPELGLTADGRTDPDQSVRALKAFTADNSAGLQKVGLPVNDASLYASHFLGANGGPRFVAGAMQNPDAPAASLVQPAQVAANRSVFFNRDGSQKTAGQVMDDFGRSFGGGSAPATRPTQIASADPDALALPAGASGLNPAVAARPQPQAAPFVATPGTASQSPAQVQPQVHAAGPSLIGAPVPTLVQPPLTRAPMQMPGATPAQVDGEEGDGITVTPPTVAAPNRQQISAQAPQAAAVAVGNTQPASSQRLGVLMRIAAMPGLSEGQSKVVSALFSNELDQTKLPESVKQYLFAKSPAGGGFDGSFADFQNKKGDEGAKIAAQLDAREKYAVAHGMDPTDAGVQAWIMGGKTSAGHVLKPGDILAGPSGRTLAKNEAASSTMPDQTADFLAERVLAGDTRALIGLGRGAQGAENLARIQGLVAQKAAERGIDATDVLHNAALAQGMGAQERSLSTQAGRMSAAATEAEGALDLAAQASAKVQRGSFVPLNQLIQMGQASIGDPDLRAFQAANNTAVNTFARAISPTGVATDSTRAHARELLNSADSPAAYDAVLRQMRAEIAMAHKAPERARAILEGERQAAKRPPGMVPNPLAPDAGGAGAPTAPASPTGVRLQPMGADLLGEARAAIQSGKPAAAVIQRLRERGFDPAGL
jgi:Transglycosylase SLT domain